MASKKPKPATTVGRKIANWMNSWHPAAFGTQMLKIRLEGKIDRAIARAVRKERERCMKIVTDYMQDGPGRIVIQLHIRNGLSQ